MHFPLFPIIGGISVSPEKRTDIIFAGELHQGRGGKWLAGLLWQGAPPHPTGEGLPTLQEACDGPQGEREALGLGQRGPHHCKHTRILGTVELLPIMGVEVV